jgi:hypothetical protein
MIEALETHQSNKMNIIGSFCKVILYSAICLSIGCKKEKQQLVYTINSVDSLIVLNGTLIVQETKM